MGEEKLVNKKKRTEAEEEEVTPVPLSAEELVSMASDAFDVEKQDIQASKKEQGTIISGNDDEELAIVPPPPPKLISGQNIRATSRPGAYRFGSCTERDEEVDDIVQDEDLNDHNEVALDLSKSVPVEATLVTDEVRSVTSITSGDDETSNNNNNNSNHRRRRSDHSPPEVYHAEPLDDKTHFSNAGAATPSRVYKWGWITVLALVAIAVIAVAVAVAVVVSGKQQNSSNANTAIPPQPTLVTLAPTVSPEARLSPFDRITHHTALLVFLLPETCNLSSADSERDDVMATVTLMCGSADRLGTLEKVNAQQGGNSTGIASDKATIVLQETDGTIDMGSCKRLAEDVMQCYVKRPNPSSFDFLLGDMVQQRASIFFTCGTNADDFPVSIETDKATATVRIEETQASCQQPAQDTGGRLLDQEHGETAVMEAPPPDETSVISMLALGRLCQPQSWPNPKIFHAARDCYESQDVHFALGGDLFTDSATYCYSQHSMSCPEDEQQCQFELDPVAAQDRSTEPHCQAETLDESLLDAALIGANIAKLVKGEAPFLMNWIQNNTQHRNVQRSADIGGDSRRRSSSRLRFET